MSVISKAALLSILAIASAAAQGKVEGNGAAMRFVSQRYGFSMAVPAGWSASSGLDTPVYFYAPDSERFIQASIPPGGAIITTESQDAEFRGGRPVTTLEAWAQESTRPFADTVPSFEPFRFPAESGVSRALVCSYDEPTYSPDQRTQHSVGLFWEFNHKFFSAFLNYNAHDPNGPAFEKLFFKTVRSIQPLLRNSRKTGAPRRSGSAEFLSCMAAREDAPFALDKH
jgi:hypothetical protein